MAKPLYFPLTRKEWTAMSNNLAPSQIKVLYHLRTLDPFGDRPFTICINDIAAELGLNRSTVSRALKRLNQEGLIAMDLIKIRVQVLTKGRELADEDHTCDHAIASCDRAIASCDRAIASTIYLENYSNQSNSGVSENLKEELDRQVGMDSTSELINSLQSQINTLKKLLKLQQDDFSAAMIGHGEIKTGSIEQGATVGHGNITVEEVGPGTAVGHGDITANDVETGASVGHGRITAGEVRTGAKVGHGEIRIRNVGQSIQHLPPALLKKMHDLGIPLDSKVVEALKTAHLSQIEGALRHIEDTTSIITSPRGVFLFQLPKQPIEVLGSRLPVKTAADFIQVEPTPPTEDFKKVLAAIAAKKRMR